MCPVSACLLQAPVQRSLDQTGMFLCRSLANEETGTVWPDQQRGRVEKEKFILKMRVESLCHENNLLNKAHVLLQSRPYGAAVLMRSRVTC